MFKENSLLIDHHDMILTVSSNLMINYGHNAGDRVLITVANQINSVVRHNMDFAARCGRGRNLFMPPLIQIAAEIEKNCLKNIRHKVFDLKISTKFSNNWDYISVSIGVCIKIEVRKKADVWKRERTSHKALY
jgi:diguanylate cyclase (GGDEF)-like protein